MSWTKDQISLARNTFTIKTRYLYNKFIQVRFYNHSIEFARQ